MSMKSVVLGHEYDEMLAKRIKQALKTLKAKRVGSWWGLGGSQQIVNTTYTLKGHKISFENETYIGVTVMGEAQAVDLFLDAFNL